MTWISAHFNFAPDTENSVKVIAGTTTREGGVSDAPYSSLNVGAHVGDNDDCVQENRSRLKTQLSLPSNPVWLNQTHSTNVVELTQDSTKHQAITTPVDAVFTQAKGVVCSVMTADCLPILLVDSERSFVSAIHAGWRGLADGIVENTLHNIKQAAGVLPANISAWIGPAIGPKKFEVGADVKLQFEDNYGLQVSCFFQPTSNNKYLADLPGLAVFILNKSGLVYVTLSNLCTYTDAERFFSYRRDGQTGRIASLIWLE